MSKKAEKWLIGAIARCSDCEWEDESYHTAQKTAREHHKKTGHEVIVESTYTTHYKRDVK